MVNRKNIVNLKQRKITNSVKLQLSVNYGFRDTAIGPPSAPFGYGTLKRATAFHFMATNYSRNENTQKAVPIITN